MQAFERCSSGGGVRIMYGRNNSAAINLSKPVYKTAQGGCRALYRRKKTNTVCFFSDQERLSPAFSIQLYSCIENAGLRRSWSKKKQTELDAGLLTRPRIYCITDASINSSSSSRLHRGSSIAIAATSPQQRN